MWSIVTKAGPWLIISLLIAAVLWQQNNLTVTHASLDAERVTVSHLRSDNSTLMHSLDMVRKQRVDNDAIAEAVTNHLGEIRDTETRIITTVEKAKQDDPTVAVWASVAVPDGVRAALGPAGTK